MVRPAQFSYNAETAENNAFQNKMQTENASDVRKKAIKEFDAFVKKLREAGIVVNVVKDSYNPPKPDAVFPNNWVSFHQEGFIVLYPIMAESRRRERRKKVIEELEGFGYKISEKHRLDHFEKVDIFLEGTGSMIFDHIHRLVYACLSPRTHERLLDEVEKICSHVAIIKNGQLLATGPVGSILSNDITIEIDAEDRESLAKSLSEINYVHSITIKKDWIECMIDEEVRISDFSINLSDLGISITRLVARKKRLEEEFLGITKGQ